MGIENRYLLSLPTVTWTHIFWDKYYESFACMKRPEVGLILFALKSKVKLPLTSVVHDQVAIISWCLIFLEKQQLQDSILSHFYYSSSTYLNKSRSRMRQTCSYCLLPCSSDEKKTAGQYSSSLSFPLYILSSLQNPLSWKDQCP